MACEYYSVSYDGKRLRFLPCDAESSLRSALRKAGTPPEGYTPFALLGDDTLLFCTVYRAHTGTGGLFIVSADDGPLLAVQAAGNLEFVLGLSRFARAVTYARYGADIFQSLLDENDDED